MRLISRAGYTSGSATGVSPLPGMLLAALLTLPAGASASGIDYPFWAGVVVIKVTPEHKLNLAGGTSALRSGDAGIDRFLDDIGATEIEVKFVDALPPLPGGTDITRFYNVRFPESVAVLDVCRDFAKVEGIELVVPWQVDYLCPAPNDPQRGNQYGLDLCRANDAYDISTGNRNTPIGMVDTGVSLNHTDLRGNIWINPGEDLNGDGVIGNDERNGRDDERDGRIDDFNGWDFVGNDNVPDDVDGHGSHTAGTASAVTNNRVGVASVGYSCAIIAVRAGTGQYITYGYEGITYAVRAGAKVISCSWGGYGGNEATRQVVQYAYEHDVLVLAASGNDNQSQMHYPSGYEQVVAVSATDRNDRKANFSNYGDWIDISAPGVDVLSTVPGGYAYYSGTSMACPFAAGVALLARAAYPEMSANEIRQILLQGADNIDNLNANYRGRLGSGRINAFRTLSLGNRPMLSVDSLIILSDDDNNGRMDPGEQIALAVLVSNSEHGQGTDSVTVQISTDDAGLTFDNARRDFPNIEPGEAEANVERPFGLSVSRNMVPHTTWLTVAVTADPGQVSVTRTFEVVIGHPDLLIVDDDEGADVEQYYYESIEAAGRGWVRWNVATQYSPDAMTLAEYGMVIWETGDAVPPLDVLDRDQILAAVNEGVNLLLIGDMIGDDEENRDLLRNYFGARHEQDSVRAYTVEGLAGNRPLGRDVQMMLSGDGARLDDNPSPSTMTPVFNADSLAVYRVGARTYGLAGVYRDDEDRGSKTAYFGFSFEGVSNVRTPRSEVLDRLYRWFTGDQVSVGADDRPRPQLLALDDAYPNPFNGIVSFRMRVPWGMMYRLAVFDGTGRQAGLVAVGTGSGGRISAAWDGTHFPSGSYVARLVIPGSAPIERSLILVK